MASQEASGRDGKSQTSSAVDPDYPAPHETEEIDKERRKSDPSRPQKKPKHTEDGERSEKARVNESGSVQRD